jgi:hypothetical protein
VTKEFNFALAQLEQMVNSNKTPLPSIILSEPCRRQLTLFIEQVKRLNLDVKTTDKDKLKLVNGLDATNKLLRGEVNVNEYQALAKTMPGKMPSVGLQVLGALMMAIGIEVAALGIVAAPVIAPAVALDAVSVLLGHGLFRYAHGEGLSHEMTQLEKSHPNAP